MRDVEVIEKAATNLQPTALLAFAAWFEALIAERFDAAIARDAMSGTLDRFAEAALSEFREGKAREL